VPDGVSTPSGSEYELEEDDGGDEGDKCPDIVQEGLNSKRRTKGLIPKPACEALSDEQAMPG